MTEHKIDLKGADEPKWLFDRSGAASRVTSSVLKSHEHCYSKNSFGKKTCCTTLVRTQLFALTNIHSFKFVSDIKTTKQLYIYGVILYLSVFSCKLYRNSRERDC